MKKMKKRRRRYRKRIILISTFIIIILVGVTAIILMNVNIHNTQSTNKIANKIDISKVKKQYSDYVKAKDNSILYKLEDNKYKEVATIHGNIELSLDKNYNIKDEYYKLLNSDYYIKYTEIDKIDGLSSLTGEYKSYKNYIPYNESIILNNKAKLYIDDNNYYEVSTDTYPIIVKDENRYGIEYNDSLVYVSKDDVKEVVTSTNTDKNHTDELAVLNYHYVVSATNEGGEKTECQQSICITDETFESQVKYLKENSFYATSMRDLELYIDGKVQLPEKSVTITIDDGWYVARSISVLEKYQMLGTLFLIGSLASPSDYKSDYLEVHSHTWDMHKIGDCPSSVGRGGILCLDENTVLEDLKKSRESLNNTTYFCYPFYDYNDRAIKLLKQAGFTMAFAGELKDSKVMVGQDKYKIPRYVIINTTSMDLFKKYVN